VKPYRILIMSTPKQLLVSKRKLFLAIISIALICSLASGSIMYVVAQGGSTPFTISSGIYPGAPNYTIWSDAGTYYVKNEFGAVSSSSALASTAIQFGINNLPVGRSNQFTVKLIGNFTILTTITLPSYTILDMYNARLKLGANTDMFKIDNTASWVTLQGGFCYGDRGFGGGVLSSGSCITDGGTAYRVLIKDMYIGYFAENGIEAGAWRVSLIDHNEISTNGGKGIYFVSDVDNIVLRDNVVAFNDAEGLKVETGALLTEENGLYTSNGASGIWFGGSDSSFLGTRVEDNPAGNIYTNQNRNRFEAVRCRVETGVTVPSRDYEEFTLGGTVYPNIIVGCDFHGSVYGPGILPQTRVDYTTQVWTKQTGVFKQYYFERTVVNIGNVTSTQFTIDHDLIWNAVPTSVYCVFNITTNTPIEWSWLSDTDTLQITVTATDPTKPLPAAMGIVSCTYKYSP
jgi:hypothetical protein